MEPWPGRSFNGRSRLTKILPALAPGDFGEDLGLRLVRLHDVGRGWSWQEPAWQKGPHGASQAQSVTVQLDWQPLPPAHP